VWAGGGGSPPPAAAAAPVWGLGGVDLAQQQQDLGVG